MGLSFGVNQALVEDQLRRFMANPDSVDPEWKAYFENLPADERAQLMPGSLNGLAHGGAAVTPVNTVNLAWQVSKMVAAYRSRGHYHAHIDPLALDAQSEVEFGPETFAIPAEEMDTPVSTDIAALPTATPRQIAQRMATTYCGTIGYELMHIEDAEERNWLLQRIEARASRPTLDPESARRVLEGLADAQEFERFLGNTYVGAKRFSLEGLEAAIPLLRTMIDGAGESGVKDVVLGMAHRGRLNVLVNILKKGHRDLFVAFNDADEETLIGRGDVKYHLGHTSQHVTPSGKQVSISLCFNPSHLEFVNPVVAGRARAKIDMDPESSELSVLPVMIHGDAAFIGQGVVVETLNLAELEGYRTGGSIHVVLNNQVGFTTSPSDSRSSRYSSDIVRFLRIPAFHVNADDLDSVGWIAKLAVEYRQRFQRDVCIDLVGYRKFGHNEGDEPRFTQPQMYSVIDRRESAQELFANRLIETGLITAENAAQLLADRREKLSDAYTQSKETPENVMPALSESAWDAYFGGPFDDVYRVDTTVPKEHLKALIRSVCTLPPEWGAHPKIKRIYNQRLAIAETEDAFDWGTGELLAYASLVNEGRHVRLSGQDSRRGTFSHRHSTVVHSQTGALAAPLNNVATGQGSFEAFDSPLSEASVLGFEYGYSLEAPADLVIWEAQFGDFANGAQVIIDQFIAAGEDKWGRLTGLVMLLPHGFEGMGPEHSYARLGRFLQLCAEDCMQVCDCTTPAQFFHLMRRQVLSPWRKPLVVMSPKSLLRRKTARSTLDDLATGGFQEVLGDVGGAPTSGVNTVLLCSGRIYYDLDAERTARNASNVHIVRLEQLYPLNSSRLTEILASYGPGTQLRWVQDEPWNMGAWYFIKARLHALFGDGLPLTCVARAESASPATGSAASHKLENRVLLDTAFA
ncbi:MAG: 2-oxoglutarate dehydrogenase E1 component [Bradymonadia bacterium]|jgi:2-oxoglutarate dehydrogenase E1 component